MVVDRPTGLRVVILIAVVVFGTGCANLTSLSRRTFILPTSGSEFPGRAIHLDAKQRLVFSGPMGICAEPSPDALSAVAAAFGAGVSIPSQGAGSVAQALQESAASIGLRTQSITLMRDTLYRICEAFHSRALNETDVIQLLQRSQDLTLGVLAIEQLTGAVVARQVALGGGANATASANLANTKASLDNARQYEASRQKELETARATKDKDKAALDETGVALKKLTDIPEKDRTDAQKAELQRLSDLQSKQAAQLKNDEAAVTAAEQSYKEAQDVTKKIAENLNSANTTATAAANGFGTFAAAIDRTSPIDKDTAKAVADAVDRIVARVVNKGHLTDTCINLLSRYAQAPTKFVEAAFQQILTQCASIIAADLEVYKKQGAGTEAAIGPLNVPPPSR